MSRVRELIRAAETQAHVDAHEFSPAQTVNAAFHYKNLILNNNYHLRFGLLSVS